MMVLRTSPLALALAPPVSVEGIFRLAVSPEVGLSLVWRRGENAIVVVVYVDLPCNSR